MTKQLNLFADYICKNFAATRADAELVLTAVSPSSRWDVPRLDAAVRPYFV